MRPSLWNTNGQQSDTRWLLDQERRISDAQIEDQTETDLTLKGFCETRQKFDASRRSALESARSVEKPTPEVALSEVRIDLFCRAQCRTEITEFVVDLGRSFDSLSNFFAEQRSVAFA